GLISPVTNGDDVPSEHAITHETSVIDLPFDLPRTASNDRAEVGPRSALPSRNGTGALPRNWRSFTGIWRKRNARTVRAANLAQLAFVYRDMAEIERQNAHGGPAAEPVR
ncbi:MAG: hypothetical protein LC792_30100, partial [Actinobacteria bacterium]|nr:hypothetical protein [Actinomycetota bacterium]